MNKVDGVVEYSTLDAFHALNEGRKNEVRKARRKIHEAVVVDVNGRVDQDEIKNKLNDEKDDDSYLILRNANPDSVEHLADNKNYIGQYGLKCATCNQMCFISGDEDNPLVKDPEGGKDQDGKELYNMELECPYCHKVGQGFTLEGQMMQPESESAEDEEPAEGEENTEGEEAEVTNDEAEPDDNGTEAAFDNDLDGVMDSDTAEAPSDDAEGGEEGSVDVADLGVEDEEGENNPDDVPEDDTVDMESGNFGDVIDDNETAEDDSGDYSSFEKILNDHRAKKKAKEESVDNSDLKPDEDKEIITEEAPEEQPRIVECVDDFFDCVNNPDHIKTCSYDNQYDGEYAEFPAILRKRKFGGFDCDGAVLIVNVGGPSDVNTLADMLKYFVGDSDISVFDDDGDQLCYGSKDYVCKRCGNRKFSNFEVPSRVKMCSEVPEACNSIYGPRHESVKHFKDRKSLAESLKNNTAPFNITRSKKEGYRYDLTEKLNPSVTTQDLIDDILSGVARIADDVVCDIYECYDFVVPKSLVVADVLSDIGLIDEVTADDLEAANIQGCCDETMFNSPEDFAAGVDVILSNLGAAPLDELDLDKLEHAQDEIYADDFSESNIKDAIASDKFIQEVRAGGISYMEPDADLAESIMNEKPDRDFNSGDVEVDDKQLDDFDTQQQSDEFDSDAFDADMNSYFDEAYDSKVTFKSESGTINESGVITLKGVVEGEAKSDIEFTLTPVKLDEGLGKTYRVTNNLSSEVFEYGE